MRIVTFYTNEFTWQVASRISDDSEDFKGDSMEHAVVVFIHAEPDDNDPEKNIVSRFLKQIKQIARKWDTRNLVLYSFSHLGDEKADPNVAKTLIKKIRKRLSTVGYQVKCTPFRCFVDFKMDSPGAALSRAFRQL
jgi:hypothetical protein